jgi:molybdopterin molybdotransferase
MSELLSVEAARAAILDAVVGPTPTASVAVLEALGRVLATPLAAALDLPPWDNSAMDGYAVRAADVAGATEATPVRLLVVGDIAAGTLPDERLRRGQAMRIATGAPLPPGADAVVPVEDTTPADATGVPLGPRARAFDGPVPAACLVHVAAAPGVAVRRRAEDVRTGEVVLEAGRVVDPAMVALAAGVGAVRLEVRTPPKVSVLATGDELRAWGSERDGDSPRRAVAAIPDANGPALMALATAAGADANSLGIGRDTLDDVLVRLRIGLAAGADLIVVSGGVSVGPYDHVRTAFAELGTVDLWRVAVQPGKPFAFGTAPRPAGGTPVLLFGLPGNPVSTFVTFELFVRPAIRALLGLARVLRPLDAGRLLEPVAKSRGRRAFLRVAAERDGSGAPVRDGQGRVGLRLAGGQRGQGSHVLSALATAEALAAIPEPLAEAPAGTPVEFWWLDRD